MTRHVAWIPAVIVLMIGVFVALPSSARAQDKAGWHVVELAGKVTVSGAGVAPVSLTDKMELHGGEQIQTEATGRLILRRGGDTLLVAPNSLVALPAADTGMFTRILQTFGTVLVNVEKRPDPHFEVRTPFLAAIVKGTTFTVSADSVSSAVQVVEGVVNVVDAKQGTSVNVTAGQTARINSRSGEGLRLDGPRRNTPAGNGAGAQHADAAAAGDKGAQHISLPIGLANVDAVKATGGLVRNDGAGATPSGNNGQANGAGNTARGAYGASGGFGGSAAASVVVGLARGNSANAHAGLNGNAGGNGNGNAGGNGNGNGGGNGNGNGGGNGNGNGGGNGNGHGHP